MKANDLNNYEELNLIAFDYARAGKTQDLKLLLNTGMSVDLCDYKGNTLLMLASYNGNIETVKLLIDNKAQVDKKNSKGQTPLGGVCFKGNLEIAKLLVKNGANIYENNGFGLTPFIFAVIFGNVQIVEYFNEKDKNRSFKSEIYLGFSKFIRLFKK
ncbi:ankyrin repeat domain-containing protein [Arcobacter lacus]|uniref:ankyrin repeat domain-containing protein n=1 Tax=Arcobacter lacus TaxID=1912876 RepID=UPI0021BB7625|nr:ankyrin repeat domain-containing protein [Arcobacter lacus]MCT7910564.1 ankyrin repeat domain-containing protein [Arcobacter lacus]